MLTKSVVLLARNPTLILHSFYSVAMLTLMWGYWIVGALSIRKQHTDAWAAYPMLHSDVHVEGHEE